MSSFLSRAIEAIARLLRATLVAAAWIMMACIVLQVVMRYVFGRPPSWTEEGAMLMFSWAILGGIALGVREGFHVRLDIVIGALPQRFQAVLERAIDAVTAIFGAYLLWSGQRFLEMTGGSVSAAIGYPIEALHVLAPISGGLVCLFALARLFGHRPSTPAAVGAAA